MHILCVFILLMIDFDLFKLSHFPETLIPCFAFVLLLNAHLLCVRNVFTSFFAIHSSFSLALPCYVFLDALLCIHNVFQHLFALCFWCFSAPPCYTLLVLFVVSLSCTPNVL